MFLPQGHLLPARAGLRQPLDLPFAEETKLLGTVPSTARGQPHSLTGGFMGPSQPDRLSRADTFPVTETGPWN